MIGEENSNSETQILLKPKLILLDVYETLLDMKDVQKKVNTLLDSNKGYTLWMYKLIQYFFIQNESDTYQPFDHIAKTAMESVASEVGQQISAEGVDDVIQLLKYLPLKEDVQQVLSRFQDDGYELAALSNSSSKIMTERMELTGLISHFKIIISTEEVKKYKPHISTYKLAAKKANVSENEVLYISAHNWDIAGAAGAGMQTAYIQQEGQSLIPFMPDPTIIVKDLSEVSKYLSK